MAVRRRLGQLPYLGAPPRRRRGDRRPEATGSLTPGLNWYRANVNPRRLVEPPWRARRWRLPTLGVWSTGDFALTEAQMTDSAEYVKADWQLPPSRRPWALDAGRGADRVNELLLDFLPH